MSTYTVHGADFTTGKPRRVDLEAGSEEDARNIAVADIAPRPSAAAPPTEPAAPAASQPIRTEDTAANPPIPRNRARLIIATVYALAVVACIGGVFVGFTQPGTAGALGFVALAVGFATAVLARIAQMFV